MACCSGLLYRSHKALSIAIDVFIVRNCSVSICRLFIWEILPQKPLELGVAALESA